MKKKSWKTTVLGIASALVAIGNAAIAYLDGDPATTVDMGVTIAAIMAALGCFFARDNDKSSEDVGAK